MGNEVTTTENALPATLDNMMAGLANMQAAAQQDGSNRGTFMKYKKGKYSFGPDDITPEATSLWAVNPQSFRYGYQCWGDGTLIDKAEAGMFEPPIVKSTLDDTHTYIDKDGNQIKAKWNAFRGFQLVCTNGKDEGETCEISGTSQGMVKAIDGLVAAVHKHASADPSTPVPVIKLATDSYPHPKYGQVHVPVLTIVEFVGMDATTTSASDDEYEDEDENEYDDDDDGFTEDDLDAADQDVPDEDEYEDEEEEPEPEPEPVKKRRRKKAPAAKPAAEPEPKPAKRRRRRAPAAE